MCGIIGGFDRDRAPFGDELAHAGCQRISHRGPDDEGFWEADGMLIGNRRLSILDLAGGHQPMFSDDGQIAVVQNGEIYNFVELARDLPCRTTCDTEVILRLYEREGEGFVRHLNGMFAIAIVDRRHGRLLLYRDRLGKKPLYLHDDGRRLLFASEVKALFAMGVSPTLDWRGLDAYLTYNYVPPPLTIFRGVRHLPPGHFLRIDSNGAVERSYWTLTSETEERPESDWHDEILELFSDAVRIRLRSDVPLGAFLSGGIDSSLVVRSMSRQLSRSVRTFCIGSDCPAYDDTSFANQVAELCSCDHTTRTAQPDLASVWPLSIYHNDQPHGDASFLPTYWVSDLARQHVKVVLTGDGGDELFAGYDHHRRFVENHRFASSPTDFVRAYVASNSIFDDAAKQALYSPTSRQRTVGCDAADLACQLVGDLGHVDTINRMLTVDTKVLLPGNNLVKPDKMSMAVGLETRSPFLDYRLVELAFRIPGELKLRAGETKSVLKRAAERWLPKNIVYRPKQMFTVPVGEWFKGALYPLVHETLLGHQAVSRGLFDPRGVSAMLDQHLSGAANHTRRIRALIVLELWQRIYIDRCLDHAPNLSELGIANLPALTAPVARAA